MAKQSKAQNWGELMRALSQAGFVMEPGGKHMIFRHPCGIRFPMVTRHRGQCAGRQPTRAVYRLIASLSDVERRAS